MTTEIDIYRAANILIRDRGEYTVIEAVMRSDKMLKQGNIDGMAL